jgi:transposase
MTLEEFIASNPDPRELKRALTVQMRLQEMKHHEIQPILGVSSNYISRWEGRYREQGIAGLRLGYKGSKGFLGKRERQAVVEWIAQEKQRTVTEVVEHIAQNYGVIYRSVQSYYDLLKSAGMSWHKGRKKVPGMMHLWCTSITK